MYQPKQLVSVAAALIPFLEHDDANRALMGSNMQRQAVPLLRSPRPRSSVPDLEADRRARLRCRAALPSEVESSTQSTPSGSSYAWRARIVDTGEAKEFGADIYQLTKFRRSNQNTCVTQKPRVEARGVRVRKGDVLADGPVHRRW